MYDMHLYILEVDHTLDYITTTVGTCTIHVRYMYKYMLVCILYSVCR